MAGLVYHTVYDIEIQLYVKNTVSSQDFYIYTNIYRLVRILHSCDYGTFGMAESFHAICHHNLHDTQQFQSFKYMSHWSVQLYT